MLWPINIIIFSITYICMIFSTLRRDKRMTGSVCRPVGGNDGSTSFQHPKIVSYYPVKGTIRLRDRKSIDRSITLIWSVANSGGHPSCCLVVYLVPES